MQLFRRRTAARRCGVIAAAALAVTLWAQPASAYVISVDGLTGTATQGWDGAGLGSVTLTWFLGRVVNGQLVGLPDDLTTAAARTAITAAMATWSSVVAVDFVETTTFLAENSIDIYWWSGDHGDGHPFDGAWNPSSPSFNTFAHAFAPDDIDTTTTGALGAGNIHLDQAENWVTSGATIGTTSATLDLQTIILHELGHSLGLGHSPVAGSTMASLYTGEDRTLSADDIAGIRTLYACRGTDCPGSGGGGDPDPGPNPVPEPTSLALLGLGMVFGFSRSRFVR